MALNQPEQIKKLLDDKKHILITFRKNGNGDAIASAVALLLFLEKQGKRADVICQDFVLPRQYAFLKKADAIKPAVSDLQKFIITLDVKDAGVQELSYDMKDEKLRIYVTPKKGFLTRDHVRTAQSDFKYDLIITLDTQDLASLGALYDNNTDLFYKTPIVNIDHENANEHFGHINVVDITATSTAEVVYGLLKQLGEEYIDEHVATALLTGMIAATHSFKAPNVKPHTLATAGKLMSIGANRDYIVQNLYRTRTVAALKLWGKALAHLEHDKRIGLVSSTITRDDFVRSGAEEHDLKDIIDELISNSPEAKLILLLHEHPKAADESIIHGMLSVEAHQDAMKLLAAWKPTGNKKQASFVVVGKTLKQVEEEVVAEIKKQLNAA